MKNLQLLREKRPLVHCIGNDISTGPTANLLLAAGARPIMTFAPQEAREISRQCAATTINCGTPTQEKFAGLMAAAKGRKDHSLIIDPVGAGASAWRKENIEKLLAQACVSVIHCNFSEAQALIGTGSSFEGVDSTGGEMAVKTATAKALAKKHHCIVVMTGEKDIVTDGNRTAVISGGSSKMSLVSGSGCMLSALLGAFCAMAQDNFSGSVSATVFWKKVAEMAADRATSPGSFASALLDCAYEITPQQMEEVKIENQ